MPRTASLLTSLTVLAFAVSASAASATALPASGSLSPNAPNKASKLTLTIDNVPTESTLPTGMTLTLQKGFTPALSGSASLCSAIQEAGDNCPAASLIGTGTETVTPSTGIFGLGGALPLKLSVYLGASQQAGCVASVETVVSVIKNVNDLALGWPPASGTGSVCAHNGGVQLSVSGLPTYAYLSTYAPMTINKLSLALGASAGALTGPWRSPATCPRSRRWTGSAGFTFAASTVNAPFTLTCKA